MDGTISVPGDSAERQTEPPPWTRDVVAAGDVVFRLVRRPRSAFVGLLRMGRTVGGEIYGYIARPASETPDVRLFPRHAGWGENPTAVRALLRAARTFHAECSAYEASHG
ncbi:hypothetical protein [Stackebrandtia soli]|uniref:hypothetical protein n=1 Tax=Stackebrandtia soli TaxID=1892856 RepID=UPI0039ECE822